MTCEGGRRRQRWAAAEEKEAGERAREAQQLDRRWLAVCAGCAAWIAARPHRRGAEGDWVGKGDAQVPARRDGAPLARGAAEHEPDHARGREVHEALDRVELESDQKVLSGHQADGLKGLRAEHKDLRGEERREQEKHGKGVAG